MGHKRSNSGIGTGVVVLVVLWMLSGLVDAIIGALCILVPVIIVWAIIANCWCLGYFDLPATRRKAAAEKQVWLDYRAKQRAERERIEAEQEQRRLNRIANPRPPRKSKKRKERERRHAAGGIRERERVIVVHVRR
jgi:hypothetical protein